MVVASHEKQRASKFSAAQLAGDELLGKEGRNEIGKFTTNHCEVSPSVGGEKSLFFAGEAHNRSGLRPNNSRQH